MTINKLDDLLNAEELNDESYHDNTNEEQMNLDKAGIRFLWKYIKHLISLHKFPLSLFSSPVSMCNMWKPIGRKKEQTMRKEDICTECPEHVEGQANDTQKRVKSNKLLFSILS